MKASRQKKIVAISSAAASVSVPPFMPNGSPVPDHYWYRISKAALNSAMRLLSAQCKDAGELYAHLPDGGHLILRGHCLYQQRRAERDVERGEQDDPVNSQE